MNELTKEIVTDGVGQIYYLLPIPFIALVLMASIWLGVTKLDGVKVKFYKVYNALIAVGYAVLAHFYIPIDERIVNDIPTLVISIIASGVAIEIFSYWRKRKTEKK